MQNIRKLYKQALVSSFQSLIEFKSHRITVLRRVQKWHKAFILCREHGVAEIKYYHTFQHPSGAVYPCGLEVFKISDASLIELSKREFNIRWFFGALPEQAIEELLI